MIAAVIRHERDVHAHTCTRFDMPYAITSLGDILRMIQRFVAALDNETHIERIQIEISRSVA